jgi:hypothetical protein
MNGYYGSNLEGREIGGRKVWAVIFPNGTQTSGHHLGLLY